MRTRLLQTAAHVVADKGAVAVPIDDFLAQAQVSRGTFYKYFPDARSLVEAMARAVSDELIAHLHPMVEGQRGAAERIAVGMMGVLRLVEQLPMLGELLTQLGWPRAQVSPSHAFYLLVGRDLERGLKSRRFAKMDLRVALDLTAAAVIGGAHRLSTETVPDDFAAQVTAACLRGLGVAPSDVQRLVRLEIELPPFAEGSMLASLAAPRDPRT